MRCTGPAWSVRSCSSTVQWYTSHHPSTALSQTDITLAGCPHPIHPLHLVTGVGRMHQLRGVREGGVATPSMFNSWPMDLYIYHISFVCNNLIKFLKMLIKINIKETVYDKNDLCCMFIIYISCKLCPKLSQVWVFHNSDSFLCLEIFGLIILSWIVGFSNLLYLCM